MSYYVHAYLVDANKVKAVYGSHDMDLLNQLSSSLKEKLDSLNNYFESEISPSEDAYSVLADIVNGEKRSPTWHSCMDMYMKKSVNIMDESSIMPRTCGNWTNRVASYLFHSVMIFLIS